MGPCGRGCDCTRGGRGGDGRGGAALGFFAGEDIEREQGGGGGTEGGAWAGVGGRQERIGIQGISMYH